MYLRLKGAGIFYKALNTPERIDVIEKMGHIEREDAAFLREAATFYRALDHGQRVSTGHAAGSLMPKSQAQFEVLTNLISKTLDARTSARPAHRCDSTRRPRAHARFLQSAVRPMMWGMPQLWQGHLVLCKPHLSGRRPDRGPSPRVLPQHGTQSATTPLFVLRPSRAALDRDKPDRGPPMSATGVRPTNSWRNSRRRH